ncbi:hypothetical protein ONZ45_g4057 [Pleurotus djamor]|nr:hypothetical protein ONZ45_g4057 [Pleurotus djamor]
MAIRKPVALSILLFTLAISLLTYFSLFTAVNICTSAYIHARMSEAGLLDTNSTRIDFPQPLPVPDPGQPSFSENGSIPKELYDKAMSALQCAMMLEIVLLIYILSTALGSMCSIEISFGSSVIPVPRLVDDTKALQERGPQDEESLPRYSAHSVFDSKSAV